MPTSGIWPNSEQNIVLTGFMGTGKSSVARELAALLGCGVIELDAEIEKNAGISIAEIFARHGEQRFREMETGAAKKAAGKRGLIISTGGGVVLRAENMEALRSSGVVFCLTAAPETILKRTGGNRERPLLQTPDPLGKIRQLLDARAPYYRTSCDHMIDTEDKTPKEVAREISEKFPL